MTRILIVDDDAELRSTLVEVLDSEGYETDSAENGKAAVEKAKAEFFDIALLDLMMPGMDGLATLGELSRHSPRTKAVMITAFATVQNAVDAMKSGASEYITKPFKITDLLAVIRRVLEEAKFAERAETLDLSNVLASMANPIRRNIVWMLVAEKKMRLMEITRKLDIEDHTKVVFHLKTLRESGVIDQDIDKSYFLTTEGKRICDCLTFMEKRLSPPNG